MRRGAFSERRAMRQPGRLPPGSTLCPCSWVDCGLISCRAFSRVEVALAHHHRAAHVDGDLGVGRWGAHRHAGAGE